MPTPGAVRRPLPHFDHSPDPLRTGGSRSRSGIHPADHRIPSPSRALRGPRRENMSARNSGTEIRDVRPRASGRKKFAESLPSRHSLRLGNRFSAPCRTTSRHEELPGRRSRGRESHDMNHAHGRARSPKTLRGTPASIPKASPRRPAAHRASPVPDLGSAGDSTGPPAPPTAATDPPTPPPDAAAPTPRPGRRPVGDFPSAV